MKPTNLAKNKLQCEINQATRNCKNLRKNVRIPIFNTVSDSASVHAKL